MNILHISPYVPSVKASHAGGVCMGKEVETLKKEHNVFVLSFINDQLEERLANEEYSKINSCFIYSKKIHKIVNALLHPSMPLFFSIRNSRSFKKNLKKIVKEQQIDAIHAEYTSMGQFVWIKKIAPDLKFILVEHDVTKQSYDRQVEESKGLKYLFNKWQSYLVEKCETKYCRVADTVLTLNDKDKILLNNYYGIDAKVLIPYYGLDFSTKSENISKVSKSLCFIGNMSRPENDYAAKRLISIVRSLNRNDIKVSIIGAYPSEDLVKEESNNIHITGFVDNIEGEILKNEIAVFPLTLGAGIKLKVLLACGLGVPVITTNIGAEGIDEKGEVLILSETDEDFRLAIVNLLDDKGKIEKKSIDSKEFVKSKFGWDISVKLLHDVYS